MEAWSIGAIVGIYGEELAERIRARQSRAARDGRSINFASTFAFASESAPALADSATIA